MNTRRTSLSSIAEGRSSAATAGADGSSQTY
jgi:hypothetical protein